MAQTDIISHDDRVELLDGEVVEMTPIGPRHAACVRDLTALLLRRLGDRALINPQNPLQIGDRSELYPDLAVLRLRPDRYRERNPGAADVLLLIEVAETSAEHDRMVKLPRYARAGIPEVWLVNLRGEHVQVFRQPTEQEYQSTVAYGRGQQVACGAFPDALFTVDDILS